MKPLFSAAILALNAFWMPVGSRAPAVIKRVPKVDDRATYEMKALIDLGGKDDIRFTGTWVEKIKSIEGNRVTTAVESRVSVEVLGMVRQSAMVASDRVELLDGALVTAAKTDSTLLFGVPRIDRLRAFGFPAAAVETGTAWWRILEKDDSMKAPPASTYLKYEGDEKIGNRDTWRVSVDANEVEIENPSHVRGMLWLDKSNGALVKGQWAITGFTYGTTTTPINARMEMSRTD